MSARHAEVLRRLDDDHAFFASNAVQIVNAQGHRVPLVPKRAQLDLFAAVEAQRAAGKPMRAIILKARKLGFCLDPSTRVLTADLRWVAIDELVPGDELVATDEHVPGGRGRARRLRRAVVEAKSEVNEPAFRLTMDDGRELVATAPHRFLCKRRGGTDTEWRTVADTRPGDEIRHVTTPWGASDVEDGWFGGLADGEGCLRARDTGGVQLTISQNHGAVLDRARQYLADRGYVFGEETDERAVRRGARLGKLCVNRINELFRLVGQTRPTRFIARSDWWDGRCLPGPRSGVAWARVVSIEPLGERRMVDLQTSRATYIAEGFVSHNSTAGVSMVVQRATRKPNHHAVIVGQDSRTASELGAMAEGIYNHLPAEIKPPLVNWSRGDGKGYYFFGEPSRQKRNAGEVGLNSSIRIDNAKETSAGRGFTFRSLLLTEVAFWKDETKMLALLNAVPDDPDTLVLIECTANGYNHFKRRWDKAVSGESSYIPIFAPWHEDPMYRDVLSAEEEERFWGELYGKGEMGEDEPRLVEQFGCDAGQLMWRRRVIVDRCNGVIEQFNQEYPASPEDAFIATGRTRFAQTYIKQALSRAERSTPELGVLRVGAERVWKVGDEQVMVPTSALWTPREATGFGERHPWWRIWEHPRQESTLDDERRRMEQGAISLEQFDRLSAVADQDGWIPPGQYVIAVDVAGGEEDTTTRELARHAIEVIDHQTLMQVAEFAARSMDAAELALQAALIGLYYNEGWLGVETTGGWGIPVVKDHLWRRYRYRTLYRRLAPEASSDKPRPVLGWMTSRRTRPQMEAGMEELLREGSDGVRSLDLARELLTYVREPDGRTGPAPGEFSDRLMAYMIAQQIAREKPLRPPRRRQPGSGPRPSGGLSYTQARNPTTGY